MKIEIEFDCSYEALIKVDGRPLKYTHKEGMWKLEGLEPWEHEETIGGIVIGRLTENLSDILQGYSPSLPNAQDDCWELWEKLDDKSMEEVNDRVNGW